MVDSRTPERLAHVWSLDPDVTFLNHGSYGACPSVVLDTQRALRERMERQPVQFLSRDLPELVDVAREQLARFIAADPAGLVFVGNATAGVNTVLRSLELEPGDELLTTDQAYAACRNALEFSAQRAGASVVVAPVPFPVDAARTIEDAILSRVTDRTRLAMIDHVASPTGLRFPLERILPALAERGVQTLVDGAHAPGMLELDLGALGADYYTGNCHKWMCAPKSVGFLVVAEAHRDRVRPLVISHGASARSFRHNRLLEEFDWQGTFDPTPLLCVPECIAVLGALLPGGWSELRARNHALALAARQLLCQALEIEEPCPADLIGSLAAVPLPAAPGSPDALREILIEQHRIEAYVGPWPAAPRRVLRVSAQLYNSLSDYERLVRALPHALAAERG